MPPASEAASAPVEDWRAQYPRAARYDEAWVRSLDMGPHPLVQLEAVVDRLDVRPGDRVLDVGCGLGASSLFLARELGVEVVGVDLWADLDRARDEVARHPEAQHIAVERADAMVLPSALGTFDAVVSIDAWEYFGTDVRALAAVVSVLRPGGVIAVTTPSLGTDPYDRDPPAAVQALVGPDAAAWHSPAWWARHWRLSQVVEDVEAWTIAGAHAMWLDWSRSLAGDEATTAMLEQVGPDELGIAAIVARRRSSP